MFDWLKSLFKEEEAQPEEKKHWLCNVDASYTNEYEKVIKRWAFILYVTDSGKRICECSIDEYEIKSIDYLGGVYNHPRYINVVVPWLAGMAINVGVCKCYNPEFPDHFFGTGAPEREPERPKPSATVLKLVPKTENKTEDNPDVSA